jgi:hypothetical protein
VASSVSVVFGVRVGRSRSSSFLRRSGEEDGRAALRLLSLQLDLVGDAQHVDLALRRRGQLQPEDQLPRAASLANTHHQVGELRLEVAQESAATDVAHG